jgi:hypothetical protein
VCKRDRLWRQATILQEVDVGQRKAKAGLQPPRTVEVDELWQTRPRTPLLPGQNQAKLSALN